MLLRSIQRLVRVVPGPARAVWRRIPERVRRVLGPLVYPVAAGARAGGFVLGVPAALSRRRYAVVCAAGVLPGGEMPPVLEALARRGHRVLTLAPDEDPAELGDREVIPDAVYVPTSADDPGRTAAVARLGWRRVSPTTLASKGDIEAAFPKVTIIVVTFANRELCAGCLSALERNTPWPALEILVVDNGSRDGSAGMLALVAAQDPRVRVVTNAENLGFARATNQGLRLATGEFVVLLNDDTAVGPGWLSRLVAHLEVEPKLGLVCPVTNEIGNDAKIPVTYSAFEGMESFALERARRLAGERRPIETMALFCAAARASTLAGVGLLDERYEVGMFEDDDLSLTLRRAGYELGIALDAFVHHVGCASFARLTDAKYLEIWESNRRRYEAKWRVRWRPPARG
jgi:GT2 family glycosyltransferase